MNHDAPRRPRSADLFQKASAVLVGGGMPVAAYGGPADIMSKLSPLGPAYQAGTLSGSPLAVAREAGVPLHAGATGGMLGFSLSAAPVRNFDDAQRADHDLFARFFRAMLDRGVWLPPSGYEAMFVSAAHDDAALEQVIEAADESLRSGK